MVRILLLSVLCIVLASGQPLLKLPTIRLPKAPEVRNFPGQCSADDQKSTKVCLDSYFALYGINSTQTLPEYFSYWRIINSLTENYGINAFDFYCDFEATLESCMGVRMTSPCMNPAAFATMYGINQTESIDYATSFQVEMYSCQNLALTKKYYNCMMDVEADHFKGLLECSITMNNEINEGMEYCATISNYVMCAENYYVGFCDEGIRG
ncbi:hypothetical protein PFISCL1PPCAC_4319, partial [Pristionchus fissidentatus]